MRSEWAERITAFAVGLLFVAVGAGILDAAIGADTDFALTVKGLPEIICAKSREVCETARDAIRTGRWDLGLRPDVATACRPSPGCFPEAGLCIQNFNCEARR